jgi:glycine betaine/proline transport system permease protein
VAGYPDTITIGDYVYKTTITDPFTTHVNEAVDWVQNPNHFIYTITSWISDHLISWCLEPLRLFLTGLPWWAVLGGTAAIAYVVSGRRPAVTAAVLIALTGVMEVWDPTMDTTSQVLVATALTLLLGIAIGVLAAEMPALERGLRPILDAMQTLPQFVYLIPVVALFNVGRVPGVIASVLYAMPVVIRLVVVGIRQVSAEAIEAAESFGATRREVLFKVKMPLARPAIMLGVNQGIVMVLAVVIVAGLVGGGGLGYLVVVGLQRDAFGTGMVASLAILCLGIALDRITQGTTETGRRVA